MGSLERHEGHFYNWYDTDDEGRFALYVSAVDSGNLAGHLMTLRAGCSASATIVAALVLRPARHRERCSKPGTTLPRPCRVAR